MKHLHYGWVMVIIAIFILIVFSFTIYTFGIFLRPLTLEFNWDRGALSGAFSVCMIISGVLAIPSGRLSDRYGPRILVTIGGLLAGTGFLLMSQVNSLWQVYLFWGLLIGISGGCCSIPIISTIPKWFAKNRGLAIGIITTGVSLGGILSAPLAQWLISSRGWQQALMILGIITFIAIIPLAQFVKHSPQRVGIRPYGEDSTLEDKQPLASAAEGLSFIQSTKTGQFWIFGATSLCFLFAAQLIITHIVPHAIDTGISAMVAASILSVIAATAVISRNITGFISDRIGGRLTLSGCLTLLTLALIWLLFTRETWTFYLFAIIFGVAEGGLLPLQTIVTTELFGLRSLGVIFGSIQLITLIGGAIGPTSAGIIFDATGDYNIALIICVIVSAVSIILSLTLLKAKTWRGD